MTPPRIPARTQWLVRLLVLLAVSAGAPLVLTPSAAADPAATVWARLRMCESSGRYGTNTGNGYYGAYQFDLPTWRSVGGTGRPDLAAPREQDHRALYLYRMRGWQPWECAGMLGLRADADARSKRLPSYADSAYIGGGGAPTPTPSPPPSPTPPPGPKPAWPGAVYAYGDCAPALRAFQLRMNTYGYGFTGTGCYYAKTRDAVLQLQRANGIRDSGRLGPKTWDAAWAGRPPR